MNRKSVMRVGSWSRIATFILISAVSAHADDRQYLQGPSRSTAAGRAAETPSGTAVSPRMPVSPGAAVAPAARPDGAGGSTLRVPGSASLEQLGIPASAARDGVYGATMEMTVGKTPVTLVVLGEGTTTLYIGSSGEISGGGLDSSVRTASTGFLDTARKVRLRFKPSTSHRFPASDRVAFTLMTTKGVMKSEAPVTVLAGGGDPLSPLYIHGQRVVTELREISERADGSGATSPATKNYSRAMPGTTPASTR